MTRRPFPHNLRVLFYADLHVGDRANGRLYTDMIEAERFITQLAIDRKVDWVAFGGDAFKSRNPHDEHKTRWLEARVERSNEFDHHKISEIDLVGNHCRWYKADNSGHVFEVLEPGRLGAVFANRIHQVADTQDTFYSTDERVLWHTLPAQVDYDPTCWAFDQPDSISICLFHGMVKGCSLSQEGTVKASEGVPLEVLDRSEFDFVMCADIHLPQMLDFKNTQGGYVGSTLQLDATDVGEKRGVLIVTFEKGATEAAVEFVPVPQAELKVLLWDATAELPDLEPYRGHLVTMKITNASALSSIEISEKIAIVRDAARYLTTSVESSDPGRALNSESSISYADPIDDFVAYLGQVPNVGLDRQTRVLEILREVISV